MDISRWYVLVSTVDPLVLVRAPTPLTIVLKLLHHQDPIIIIIIIIIMYSVCLPQSFLLHMLEIEQGTSTHQDMAGEREGGEREREREREREILTKL